MRKEKTTDDSIGRRAAIEAVKKNTFRLTFAEEQNCEGHVAWSAEAVYSDVMEGALLELPSAQPEQKRGKWVGYDGDWFKTMCKCSECGAMIDINEKYRNFFCYHCGADMRGEE